MSKSSNTKPESTLAVERRKRFLENLIKEAIVNVLAEQAQDPMAAAPPPAPAPAPVADPAPAPAEGSAEDGNAAKAPSEFTVDDMVERLNTVRGGRSFTDPEVYGQLISWFKKLNDDQKAVLQNFLIEIGKIVVNIPTQSTDQQAADPTAPAPAPPAPQVAAPPAETPPVAAGQAPV